MAQVQEALEEQQEVMASNDPAYEAWFRRKVEAGLRDVREGRVLSAEDVEAEMDAFLMVPANIHQNRAMQAQKTSSPLSVQSQKDFPKNRRTLQCHRILHQGG